MLDSIPRAIYESWLVTIYDPTTIPANFHGLEAIIALGFVLSLVHARRERRLGRSYGLLLWLTALFYGVWMELLTYNTIDNFEHAQFTVMLYFKRLPLYVVMLYPTFIYVAVQAARRLKGGAVGAFFTAGLLALMIDVPFDIMGPELGWWWWHEGAEDPMGLVAVRWLGVPVTSYCWHLLFDGSHALVTGRIERRLAPRLDGRGALATLAALVPLTAIAGVIALITGVIVMMPFHGFRALGISDGAFTVTLLVVSALALLTTANRADGRRPEWGLLAWVLGWFFFYVVLAVLCWGDGALAGGTPAVITIAAVSALAVALHAFIHFRGEPGEAVR